MQWNFIQFLAVVGNFLKEIPIKGRSVDATPLDAPTLAVACWQAFTGEQLAGTHGSSVQTWQYDLDTLADEVLRHIAINRIQLLGLIGKGIDLAREQGDLPSGMEYRI